MNETKKWVNMPIRMITGWAAEWCCLNALLDEHGNVLDFNDSEDIVWFRHLRQHWHIDAGFYRNIFVVHFLVGALDAPGKWDESIVATFKTEDPIKMIECVENWMLNPPINHDKQ